MSVRNVRKEHPVEDDNPASRQRAASSDPKPLMNNIPPGVSFISIMNDRKRFFLPSTKNKFGGIKSKKLLCDSGCNSVLLPIESIKQLDEIFAAFQGDIVNIGIGSGVGSLHLSLNFNRSSNNSSFTVNLCDDLFQGTEIYVKKLRFSLCSEDADHILSNPEYLTRFGSKEISDLQTLKEAMVLKRRSHGLLGQDILQQFCLVRFNDVELYVNHKAYSLPKTFDELWVQMKDLKDQITDFPEGFKDWEDDDFAFNDDEWLQSVFYD